jgi:hypothetical protein
VKNCLTCDLAQDQGSAIVCGFKPEKLVTQFPMYPVFLVTIRRATIRKDKIPAKDCPAFKPKKGAG